LSIAPGLVRRPGMNNDTIAPNPSHAARRWTGRILGALAVLFLTFDAVAKILLVKPVVEGSAKLGFTPDSVFAIGIVLLACVICYVIPRLSIIGAVLLTGYLGGAIATHVRMGDPLLTHTLFPIYVAAIVWGALYLRDDRLRSVLRQITAGAGSATPSAARLHQVPARA
jgi:hypothetical protein